MARLKPQKTVETNYRRILPKLLRRYFKRGRKSAGRHTTIPELHQFRIRTKRIRYIAELYEPLFRRELSAAVGRLRDIQQILGDLQDQSMILAFFEKRIAVTKDGARQAEYARVMQHARQRQKEHRRAFQLKWAELERSGFQTKLLQSIRK